MNFDAVEKQFLSYNDRTQGQGASDDEIRDAEKKLGLTISGGFRQFLRRLGWAGAGSIEIYGLGSDVPRYLNLVEITLSERNEMRPKLRPEFLPVMNDGGGNLYCLSTNRKENGESPIVFWDHSLPANQEPEFISISFAEWFSSKLSESVSD